jgi:iron complex transport system substrate-binding protein
MKLKKLTLLLALVAVLLAGCSGVSNPAEDQGALENAGNAGEENDSSVVDETANENTTTQEEVNDEAGDSSSDDAAGEEVESSVLSIEVVDDLDRTLKLEGPAQRIVSLAPSITETLFAIGAGEQMVGREDTVVYPEEALEVPSVGSLWGDLPVEAILALEPDLVLAGEIISQEQVQALEELGLTVFWQANPREIEGLYNNIEMLGLLTGRTEQAIVLNDELVSRVVAIEAKVSQVDISPLVFYELDATDPENPWTAGKGTFIDLILSMAGGQNLGAVLEGEWVQVSSEEVINQNPDFILLADALYGATPEVVSERPGWSAITAVQNEDVYPFDPYLLSVPGPSLVKGLEEAAAILHPDLFE